MFQAGIAANPTGKNGKHWDKFTNALKVAFLADDGKRIRDMAEKVASLACAGEQWAVELAWNRLEGKPRETTEINLNAAFVIEARPVSRLASVIEHIERSGADGVLPRSVPDGPVLLVAPRPETERSGE